MGKEWLYWVGGGGGAKRGRPTPGEMKEAEEASASDGCMCAIFHLFHLHHFQFPSTHRNHSNTHPNTLYPFLQEEATTTTRGVEAPRNSLELEETAAMKLEQNLNFPVGIQIKTRHSKTSSPRIPTSKSQSRLDDISSECSSGNSPGTKTPSVVARLMGLDLLPQCTSPSISSNPHLKSRRSFFDYDITAGVRSLPETPRVSSSSRRSDVERHRLSLQINKENTINQELALSDDRKGRFNKQDENRSPKQIVKHVRRSVGLDITNRNTDQYRRDENLMPAKKNIKILSKHDSPDSKQSNVRFLDHNKIKIPSSSRISSSYDSHQIPLMQERHQQQQKHSMKVSNGGKCSSPSRLKKLPRRAADADLSVRKLRKDEFVRSRERNKLNILMENKSKSTPLSCDNILNINGPTLLQVKKGPSPPPTKLPQKQSQVSDALSSKSSTQLSSKPRKSYKQLQLQRNKILTPPATVSPCSTNGGATALHGGAPPEHRNYIQIILKHAGIINQVNPLTKWHTPSHPIDPGIFHHLEFKAAAVLSHQCNRKLIFELVDELLAETLTTHFSLRRRISPVGDGGCFPLVEELCKKIESFPEAKCVVLEDIDSLIDRDLCESQSNGYLGEEEEMVCEIEGEIVEWLVREAVAVMGGAGDAAEEKTEARICGVGI